MTKALIVGAGLGGLTTALRLAKRGFEVTIVEKNEKPGGRLNQIVDNGFVFDTGPSFFSMSYEFEEFAKDCGIVLPFKFVELDPLYAVNFRGTDEFFLITKDIKKLSEQLQAYEPNFEQKMTTYLAKCQKIFEDTVDVVIKRNFDNLWDFARALLSVNPIHLPVLFRNFWKQVSIYFQSQIAREIISLVAFFLGRTPFDTMGVYTLLSYTEFKHDGYYNVEGGMYKIVEGLIEELQKNNIKLIYNTEIIDFVDGNTQLKCLIDKNGNKHYADIFVINADAAVFRNKIFKRKKFSDKKMNQKSWTMGYLTFYLGLNCKLPQVHHHNYFLGKNYKEYANNVMRNPGTLEKPYYYVNVVSRHNNNCAPAGCESLFFVCPVPNLMYKKDWSDANDIVDSIIEDFSNRIKQDIRSNIVSKTVYTPLDWQQRFNLWQGSGLGLSHTMWQIGAFRPHNYDELFDNVFYVGASTIPGAGLPMAVISSKLVTERVIKFAKK